MIIYTSTKKEIKTLNINNVIPTRSVVYINDIIYDDVILGRGSEEYPNWRVLELSLNSGDVVSAMDNNLITYTIE